MSLHIVILAAGMGKRMHSSLPKVLHPVGGTPMLEHVIKTAAALNPAKIHLVVGHEGHRIREACAHLPVVWVEQPTQMGTGHAVLQALPNIPDDATVMVLYADVPLIKPETLAPLIHACVGQDTLGLLVAILNNPYGLGRILRNDAKEIIAIIEEKDASDQQRQIHEIYTGICCVAAKNLKQWLPKLKKKNAQQEYYLTDIVQMAVENKTKIASIQALDPLDIQGINDRSQLQIVERAYQARLVTALMNAGTTFADALRVDIRGQLHCGQDVFIDINTLFEGQVSIGDNSHIEPNCILKNVQIGRRCVIAANSVLEDSVIDDDSHVGPFARLRPGTRLANNCKIGNFVETKNAVFGSGTKANHLSYLGDVTIGTKVNVGAGTITCNYDGANKHHTIIEDDVHIGSDTQLVAPITIGKSATIGAGSTIRTNVPPNELTLTTSEQKTIFGWQRPVKKDTP